MSQSTVLIDTSKFKDVMDFKESDVSQSFLDWLLRRHNYTPLTIRLLCRQTGGDYYKVMSWYHKRYHYELDLMENIVNNNPFSNMEENQNGKCNLNKQSKNRDLIR